MVRAKERPLLGKRSLKKAYRLKRRRLWMPGADRKANRRAPKSLTFLVSASPSGMVRAKGAPVAGKAKLEKGASAEGDASSGCLVLTGKRTAAALQHRGRLFLRRCT
jgi:hypothetical protein